MPAPLAPRAFHRVARWCAYWAPVRDVRFEAARASALAEAPFSCKKHSAHPDAHFSTAGRLRGTTPTSSSRNRQASAHRFFRPILGADFEMAPAPTPAAERELAFGAAARAFPTPLETTPRTPSLPAIPPSQRERALPTPCSSSPFRIAARHAPAAERPPRASMAFFRRVCGASARGGCSPLFDRAPRSRCLHGVRARHSAGRRASTTPAAQLRPHFAINPPRAEEHTGPMPSATFALYARRASESRGLGLSDEGPGGRLLLVRTNLCPGCRAAAGLGARCQPFPVGENKNRLKTERALRLSSPQVDGASAAAKPFGHQLASEFLKH
ncbi:hypothetical protein ERJ75_001503300 [Trypanosoma vivax]|nr:hypothetical protein ERJ75_001503300 [Trypanosoma vivax]